MSGWRMFIGGAVIAVILVVAALVWIDRASPVEIVIETRPTGQMRVSIAGAVASPGVVAVPSDARLADVANAAGGFTESADYTGLNLAGRIGDGEQIVIPSLLPVDARATPAVVESSTDADAPIELNSATAEQLDELPGIGEVLAARIIEYREEHGPFASIEELAQVDGISLRMVEEMRPMIVVDPDG